MLGINFAKKELPKYKRTLVLWISIVFPILCAGMTYLIMEEKMPAMLKDPSLGVEQLWMCTLRNGNITGMWTMVLISVVGLIAALIISMDKDSGTMKVILATPTKRMSFYIQKFISSYGLVIFLVILNNILLVFVGKFLGITGNIPFELVGKQIIIQSLSLFAVCSIQIYLAFYCKNIMVAIGFGAAGALAGLGVMNEMPEVARMLPYSYPYAENLANATSMPIETILYMSICMGAILLLVGITQFKKMDIN